MAASPRPDDVRGSWQRDTRASVGRTFPVPAGAPAAFTIVVETHVVEVATEWEPHVHPAYELVRVRHGTLTARLAGQVFTISEGFGLGVPAGLEHAGRLTAGVELYDVFFAPDRTPPVLDGPTAVAMGPVLQALLVHLARRDLDPDARARAEAVVFDVLEPSDRPRTPSSRTPVPWASSRSRGRGGRRGRTPPTRVSPRSRRRPWPTSGSRRPGTCAGSRTPAPTPAPTRPSPRTTGRPPTSRAGRPPH
ncbi:AraC family ligand binding domain-containing protein [Promicromonospora sp. NPDC090134]|uniref:AraC family ligand binding domain-containing protein n=1 Tax=Promicromonospora sp. NPDC090134 TaxID=3364408 RepID=UPI0037F8FA19